MVDQMKAKTPKPKPWTCPTEFSQYIGDVDYTTYNPCQHGSDCCRDDYCRCGRITNTSIKNISIDSVVAQITKGHEGNFFEYCIDRLARSHKLYDQESWDVMVCGGYYGQEVDGVRLINQDFMKAVDKCFALNPQDRIKLVLTEEYGFVLPELETRVFEQKEVKRDELEIPNTGYHKKIKPGLYSNTELPIGIYKQTASGYALVDGYHRYVDLVQNTEAQKVQILAATKNG